MGSADDPPDKPCAGQIRQRAAVPCGDDDSFVSTTQRRVVADTLTIGSTFTAPILQQRDPAHHHSDHQGHCRHIHMLRITSCFQSVPTIGPTSQRLVSNQRNRLAQSSPPPESFNHCLRESGALRAISLARTGVGHGSWEAEKSSPLLIDSGDLVAQGGLSSEQVASRY